MGVHRNADDLDLPGLKVVQPVIEGDQLGRANEGEIQRIEEQHSVLALGGTREVEVVDEGTVPKNGSSRKVRGLAANQYGHCYLRWVCMDMDFDTSHRLWHFLESDLTSGGTGRSILKMIIVRIRDFNFSFPLPRSGSKNQGDVSREGGCRSPFGDR